MEVKECGFSRDKIEFFGSKFCIGNGYYGYRGTLEEYGREQLVACTLSEVFDDSGNGWREPVNVPNGLYAVTECDGERLSVLEKEPEEHEQSLELDGGIHRRVTKFRTKGGKQIEISSERFASLEDMHLLILKYTIRADQEAVIEWHTGIDCDIWDINGPHFREQKTFAENETSVVGSETIQNRTKIAVGQKIVLSDGKAEITESGTTIIVKAKVSPERTLEVVKYVSICKETDCADPVRSAFGLCEKGAEKGYTYWKESQVRLWRERYDRLGIRISGDAEAELAVYYSCYLLLSSAPFHTGKVAIPARGLSGQVYKGAFFWDTEIYMLPMFAFCEPAVARNLVSYRVENLKGALKKAAEYGYQGAFFPWESQENGEDGCTHYNLTDIFTGRKMRTYFRDKQIHISADVVYGLWKYMTVSGDYSLLLGNCETRKARPQS